MNEVVNAFSVLALDVGDEREQIATVNHVEMANSNGRKKKNKARDSLLKDNGKTLENAPEVYKLPLVWIDLEMTGLDVEVDRILEIACIITDGNLTKLIEGPHLVIHQSKDCMDKMGEWCQTHHAASGKASCLFTSGLTEKVLQSTVGEHEAERQVAEFVKHYVVSSMPLLAGNSIYTDYIFLKKYMPDLASLFSHVLVDVSSIKALCVRWYPKENRKAPSKEKKHRALDDIKESIAELKYFKETIFKSHKSKR